MPDSDRESTKERLRYIWGLIFGVVNADIVRLLIDGINLFRSIAVERSVGFYEVLDFDHTLELCDIKGKKAIYHKRETVRLLQDHVAAYLDQAWGKGKIFADYRCSPGTPVDRYRCGHGYCVLISLREVKRRGDTLHISIDRTIMDGFNEPTGWSETAVRHRTHHFRTAVIFPKNRTPAQVALVEVNRNRTTPLGEANVEVLPDGRRKVFWETTKPTLFETYTLKWAW